MGALGRRAAEQGVPVGRAVDLYLSATWRLWRRLPVVSDAEDPEAVRVAGEAMSRVVNDTIAALADGYLAARRQMVAPRGGDAPRPYRRPAVRRSRRRRHRRTRRTVRPGPDWFTLHAAVLGARLLGWPGRQLATRLSKDSQATARLAATSAAAPRIPALPATTVLRVQRTRHLPYPEVQMINGRQSQLDALQVDLEKQFELHTRQLTESGATRITPDGHAEHLTVTQNNLTVTQNNLTVTQNT